VSTSVVELQAAVATSVKVGTVDLFSLSGSLAVAIDADGFYGHAQFGLAANAPTLGGFALDAKFVLELNTAGVSKDIQTFSYDPATGSGLGVQTVNLAAQTLRLAAYGGSPSNAFSLVGRFGFLISPSVLEVQASVKFTGGRFVVPPTPKARCASSRRGTGSSLVAFLRIAPPHSPAGGGTDLSGTGFTLTFNAPALRQHEVDAARARRRHGTARRHAHGLRRPRVQHRRVAGFRIEGEIFANANAGSFAVAVDASSPRRFLVRPSCASIRRASSRSRVRASPGASPSARAPAAC
jgi:hypothetical protein